MFPNADSIRDTRAIAIISLLATVFVCAPVVPAQSTEDKTPDDRLEAYLLDRGMLELLVSQLNQRLERETRSRERTAVAERLAAVYARLLSEANSAEEQKRWETAATRLLNRIPDANTIELRLSLARSSYTRVESVAERYRLRMLEPGEREDALIRLRELREKFSAIARDADRRVRELEREEERAPRVEAGWLAEALAQSRRQRSMAYYLAGWSAYFLAELDTATSAHATDAIESFGWLLGADRGEEATLEYLSVDSLRYEHIARAALATASCYGLRAQHTKAEDWLNAIESAPALPASVEDQVFSRRLEIRARADDWAAAAELVAERRGGAPVRTLDRGYAEGQPLSVADARLLAVCTFEEIKRRDGEAYIDSRITALRDIALGDLVVTGQLGHVLDLASRYNTENFGDSSFVALHVRGLTLYQKARDLHEQTENAENPSDDQAVIALYRDAAELLEHALDTTDAGKFAVAEANTMLLIGLAKFYGGKGNADQDRSPSFVSAADALEDASIGFTDPQKGADALWMAIRALDEIQESADPEAAMVVSSRRDALVKRFLQQYPGDEKSAALIIRLAEAENIPAAERLRLLREVPDSNPLRESALRYAASLAFTMYRQAKSESDRDFAAGQFAELAEPLIAIDQRRGASGDTAAQRAAVSRARQAADALLAMRVPDLARAERVIDTLNRMLLDGFESADEAESEILFRTAQLALAKGDERSAEQIVQQLRDRGDEFATPSVRVFYRDAAIEFERTVASNAADSVVIEAAERLLRAGDELLGQIVRQTTLSEGDAALAVAVRIRMGHAAQRVWRLNGDQAMLTIAYARFRDALKSQPRNTEALLGVGRTGGAAGHAEEALEAWRVLLSGTKAGSGEWFEARTEHLVLLAKSNPDRAREVLRQHAVLYPKIGPEPYRSRLIEIGEDLGLSLPLGDSP
ncbi:MAG: hypothetical protein ACIAQF_05215 [Phycisphaerales bacterium JB065]